MSNRSDLDWSAIDKEEDPVRGDCDVMKRVVNRLKDYTDVLEGVCAKTKGLTDGHAYFVGNTAQAVCGKLQNASAFARCVGEICDEVHSTLLNWVSLVEQYQSEADPMCREGMTLRDEHVSLKRSLDDAKALLDDRRIKLSDARQLQRALRNQGSDPDAELDDRIVRLQRKVDDSIAERQRLQSQFDEKKARISELHDKVTTIEQQYQDDGKRIVSSLDALIGELASLISNYLDFQDVVGVGASGGKTAGDLVVFYRQHKGSDWKSALQAVEIPAQSEDAGNAVWKEVVENQSDFVKDPLLGGVVDGVATYGERVDQYGLDKAAQDGAAHFIFGTISGSLGTTMGSAAESFITIVTGGMGVAQGAFVGKIIGTTVDWNLSSSWDGLYDNWVHRGDGDDLGSHIEANRPFA
ncbi:hypothetical protein JS530_03110 [Bifidobacterium sp. LC6]|uniref:LXG domain-containing protein n=1 Tax=Bifidobacterium colobi TaxID=2809026 RepID=A0ABS5UU04_9BIFI|nr:hypothetical protein [Bifidobacterium colobi]MBT1174507.1 hypothetical protein [Bifidobacterium colobi]